VLASTYSNFELIIVDDCSKDHTVNIAKSYVEKDSRIKLYVNEKNLGDYPNRNRAASYAMGKYIKYLDSDDVIYPYSLHIMVEAIEKFPKAAYGIPDASHRHLTKPFPFILTQREAYFNHFFDTAVFSPGPSASIINKDIFLKEGMFNVLRYSSDTELWLRLSKKYSCVIYQPFLIWWRVHEGQEHDLGNKNMNYLEANFSLYNNYLKQTDIPIDPFDAVRALQNYQILFLRNLFLANLKILNLKRTSNLIKKYKIPFSSFILSVLPFRKLKKIFLKVFKYF
jgi:glycosyltransferase involved in cell wall biosynthesis